MATKKLHHIWIVLMALILVMPYGMHVSAAVPPPNDDFDNALVISAAPYTHIESTDGATPASLDPSSDDPVLPCIGAAYGFRSVWFRFTPATTGLFTVDTVGSSFDTVLGIWTGSRGYLVSQGCNDDGAGGGMYQSRLQIPVSAGQTYYIEVVGLYDTEFGSLTFHASWFGKNDPLNGTDFMSIDPVLSWTPGLGVDFYDVCIDQINNGTCDGTWKNAGTATSYQITGLNFEETYYWQVRAHTGLVTVNADSGIWWSFNTGFGKDDPSNLAEGQPTSLLLKWFPHPDANSYQYCLDDTNNSTCDTAWTSTNELSANFSGLNIGHKYYWQVRAVTDTSTIGANNDTWWSFTIVIYKVYLPVTRK